MTSPLQLVNNPAEIEERNLCFINAPTQAFLNLEITKKHFQGKSFSDLAKKPISAEIKRLFNECCPCANNKVRCSNQGVCFLRAVKKTFSLFSLPSVVMVVLPKDGNLKVIPESQITLTVDGCDQVFKLKLVADHIGADMNQTGQAPLITDPPPTSFTTLSNFVGLKS